jgi:hypothetical protein
MKRQRDQEDMDEMFKAVVESKLHLTHPLAFKLINLQRDKLQKLQDRKHFESAQEKLFEAVHCSICLQVMANPYSVECGHTFCYDCLSKWIKDPSDNVCPQCRAPIHTNPIFNRSLEQQIDTIVTALKPSSEKTEIIERLALEKDKFKSTQNLWEIPPPRQRPILDMEDNVQRYIFSHIGVGIVAGS